MKTCSYCHAQLDEHMNFCPLCGHATADHIIEREDDNNHKKKLNIKSFTEFQMLNDLQRRKLLWEIAGIILMSGLLVTLIIDLLAHGQITWSKYTMSVCLVLFANTSLLRFMPGNLFIIMGGSLLSTSALLLLLDIYEGSLTWSITLGVPVLLAVYLVTFAFIVILQNLRDKGLNLIAYILLAAGLLSIFSEGLIALHTHQQIRLDWSLVVIASVWPVSAFLFFIHYRLQKGTDLRRFFHI